MATPARGTSIAADAVLVGHALFALFAVFGALLTLIDRRVALFHLLVVAWSSLVNLAHWTCPLTPLEQNLRERAGQLGFKDGWLKYYIEPWLRPLGMPRHMELVAGVSIVVWNAFLYGLLFYLELVDYG